MYARMKYEVKMQTCKIRRKTDISSWKDGLNAQDTVGSCKFKVIRFYFELSVVQIIGR